MARKRSTSPTDDPAAEVLPAQPSAIEAPPAMAIRHDLVDPAVPAGMVRISNGGQERFIWPVHLAGWQQQGWTLVAAATGVQITPPPAGSGSTGEIPAPSASEPMPSSDAPTATRSDRALADGWGLESTSPDEELLVDELLL
jgi:hypothetical protein